MSQQLVKKGANGGMVNVNPKSWIEAIKDKNTGQTLVEILQGFNMYFLPYNGNTSSTRCLVPTMLRKKGLWITYVKYDGNVYTEWYAADELDDKSWGDSSNWRIGNNTLVGDITISANDNWVINGTETEFKAVGEKGNTPLLRVANNRLQVSYNLGDTYIDVTNNPVYTKFRWLATSGDTQANNVGRIQASTDEGKTWTNMSNDFANNLHISRYIGVSESLPTSGIAEGTIYAKGPYYAEDDTLNDNPIYRLWVYAWKGNTLAWQDNGEFTSIAAGVVQETGYSETEVMSQKAVTDKLTELGSKRNIIAFEEGGIDYTSGKEVNNDKRGRSNYIAISDVFEIQVSGDYVCFVYAYDKTFNLVESILDAKTLTYENLPKKGEYIRIVLKNNENESTFNLSEAINSLRLETSSNLSLYNNIKLQKNEVELKKNSSASVGFAEILYEDVYSQRDYMSILGLINKIDGKFVEHESASISNYIKIEGGIIFNYRTPLTDIYAGYSVYDKNKNLIYSHRGTPGVVENIELLATDGYYVVWCLEEYGVGEFSFMSKKIKSQKDLVSVVAGNLSEQGLILMSDGSVDLTTTSRQNSGLVEIGDGIEFNYSAPYDNAYAGFAVYDQENKFLFSKRNGTHAILTKSDGYFVRWSTSEYSSFMVEYNKNVSVGEYIKDTDNRDRFKGKKIYCLGSSSTENLEIYNYKAYPYWLKYWNRANVINLGKSGATLIESSNSIYGYASKIQADADYILIMIGSNDVYSENISFEDNGMMSDFVSAYKYLIESITLKSPLATIGLIIPYQTGGMISGSSKNNYEKVKESIKSIATMYAIQVVDIGECGFNGLFDNNSVTKYSQESLQVRKNAMASDSAHLNESGQIKMAKIIDGFLHRL